MLTGPPGRLAGDYVDFDSRSVGLDTPYDIVRLGSVASTQDAAKAELSISARPTLVVAERQTEGRGRQGRRWEQPDRAMFSSLSFTPDWDQSQWPIITLCTAVALSEAIDDVVGIHAEIKWPNDLLWSGNKIAGILVESSDDAVTVGCGANVWWRDHPPFAGAMFDADPGPEVAERLAASWVDRLLAYLACGPSSWPRERYFARSWTMGRDVSWDAGTGRAVGLDVGGGLVVETSDGRVVINAGEVHTRGRR